MDTYEIRLKRRLSPDIVETFEISPPGPAQSRHAARRTCGPTGPRSTACSCRSTTSAWNSSPAPAHNFSALIAHFPICHCRRTLSDESARSPMK